MAWRVVNCFAPSVRSGQQRLHERGKTIENVARSAKKVADRVYRIADPGR